MAGIFSIDVALHMATGYVIEPAAGVIFGGIRRDLEYSGKWNTPNILPSPDAALHAYYHGDLSPERLYKAFRSHGMYIGPTFSSDPNLDLVGPWYARAGLDWQHIIDSHKPHVTIAEAIQLANRDEKYENNLNEVLKLEGFKDKEQQDMVKEFLKEIPSPSELVHFTLRHGFEPDVIYAYKENLEFPQTSRDWFAKLGLDYDLTIKSPIDGKTYPNPDSPERITWADLYWWTHWVPISPSAAYSMHQRIREDNRDEWSEIAPDATPYTIKDVERWLRVNDYPPGVRQNLVALSYIPLGRIDIRRMHNVGVLEYPELIGKYRSLGYSPKNAKLQADLTNKLKLTAETKPLEEATKSKSISLYKQGVISEDTFKIQLYRLSILDPEQKAGFDTSLPAFQLTLADESDYVNYTVNFVKLEIVEEKVKARLKAYHSQFIQGIIGGPELETDLLAIGVQKWKIDDILEEWNIELTGLVKHTSVSENVKWAKEGIINLNELDKRLTNLHVSLADRFLWTQEVVNKMTHDAIKRSAELVKAQQKTAEQQAKQQAAAAKAAASNAQRIVKARQVAAAKAAAKLEKTFKESTRLDTLTNIKSWWKDELINEEWVRERLAKLGITPGDINLVVEQLKATGPGGQ